MIENRLCKNCINRKTMNCPNSSKCMNTKDKPFYVDVGARNIGKTYLVNLVNEKDKEIERLNNIIKRLEEFIEKEIELYTIELTEENEKKLSIVAPIKGVYKEIYNVLQELKGDGSNDNN